MTKLRCPIDENAQSKFGLEYIEALFRNSKQKTQNVKNTTMMNLKLLTYENCFQRSPEFRLEQIK